MTTFSEPPVSHAIAAALVIFGVWAGARGARRVSDGLAGGSALELVRGLRLAVFALVAGFFAIGLVSAKSGFVVVGAIILAEELYETGVLAVLARLSDRAAAGDRPASTAAHTAICAARTTS